MRDNKSSNVTAIQDAKLPESILTDPSEPIWNDITCAVPWPNPNPSADATRQNTKRRPFPPATTWAIAPKQIVTMTETENAGLNINFSKGRLVHQHQPHFAIY